MEKTVFLISLVLLLAVVSGCANLSQKAKKNNISIAFSTEEVDGMEFIYSYSTDRHSSSIDSLGIKSANIAAKNGYKDITVLVEAKRFLASGKRYRGILYEISYWK
ncbi:MAG: hypothetical protein FWG99_09795 [Treponema sp.]|nr:hypothetical protein [Treponema sp.]